MLCDGCPRSYHLTCLGVEYEDLPEGDWECPKCDEKRAFNYKKLVEFEHKRAEAYSKFVAHPLLFLFDCRSIYDLWIVGGFQDTMSDCGLVSGSKPAYST